jgi:undecaprenyl-diphosphatase
MEETKNDVLLTDGQHRPKAVQTVVAVLFVVQALLSMFGASLLKLLKFGFALTGAEMIILLVGMVSAFVVSMLSIKFLMGYVKKHDFKVFGYYRIVLGVIVLAYFLIFG